MAAPIMNSYKRKIFFKRLLMSLCGIDISRNVKNIGLYFIVLLLFIMPWALSIITFFWKNKKNNIPKICDIPIIIVGCNYYKL